MGIVDVARWAASGAGAAPATMTSTLAVEDDVSALDVPPLPHLLKESLPETPRSLRGGRRGTPEKAYAMDFRLRLGGAPHDKFVPLIWQKGPLDLNARPRRGQGRYGRPAVLEWQCVPDHT